MAVLLRGSVLRHLRVTLNAECMDKNTPLPKPSPLMPARPGGAEPVRQSETVQGPPIPARPAATVAPVAAGGGHHPAAERPDAAEVLLEVGGRPWKVTVAGRSLGGTAVAPTRLLLLRFSSGGEEGEVLERLVVGSGLSSLTHEQLTLALAGAAPPPDPGRKTSLFAGAAERRTRKG